jgi:hypothetical protein
MKRARRVVHTLAKPSSLGFTNMDSQAGPSNKKFAASSLSAGGLELPWYVRLLKPRERRLTLRVEKYRPRYLEDVVGNEETIERLKVIARDGNVPHLIISVRNTLQFCLVI